MRQIAGSERLGGLRITIYPCANDIGNIEVLLTDWHSGELHEYPMPEYADLAVDSVKKFSKEHFISLDDYDIRLDRFLFHHVDSHPKCYEQAARSAFRSAIESMKMGDL